MQAIETLSVGSSGVTARALPNARRRGRAHTPRTHACRLVGPLAGLRGRVTSASRGYIRAEYVGVALAEYEVRVLARLLASRR